MSVSGLDVALQLLDAAQRELDERGAPIEIGAQLDLVICRLRDVIEVTDQIPRLSENIAGAEAVVRN
jgi:hypothetical protein